MVDTQVDPTSWLLQMLLQGKEGYICLFWIFSDQYPEMKLLCLVVDLLNILRDLHNVFHKTRKTQRNKTYVMKEKQC